jgi:hypothetical protein
VESRNTQIGTNPDIDRDNERRAVQVIAGLLLGLAVIFAAVIVVARA